MKDDMVYRKLSDPDCVVWARVEPSGRTFWVMRRSGSPYYEIGIDGPFVGEELLDRMCLKSEFEQAVKEATAFLARFPA